MLILYIKKVKLLGFESFKQLTIKKLTRKIVYGQKLLGQIHIELYLVFY